MDERYETFLACFPLRIIYSCFLLSTAAFQVGLSFLTTHMRRAVSACTSPEVFFSRTGGQVINDNAAIPADALGLAMEALHISEITSGNAAASTQD
jgi:hypothetical protein